MLSPFVQQIDFSSNPPFNITYPHNGFYMKELLCSLLQTCIQCGSSRQYGGSTTQINFPTVALDAPYPQKDFFVYL